MNDFEKYGAVFAIPGLGLMLIAIAMPGPLMGAGAAVLALPIFLVGIIPAVVGSLFFFWGRLTSKR